LLAGALSAGAAIQEGGILDFEERITQIDKADIQTVYEAFKGSHDHLRSLVSALNRWNRSRYVGPTHENRWHERQHRADGGRWVIDVAE
jgi:hypothetical protein